MMYNYPFFSFPHSRRYTNYPPVKYTYARRPVSNSSRQLNGNSNNQIEVRANYQTNYKTNHQKNLGKGNILNDSRYAKKESKHNIANHVEHNKEKKEEASSKRSASGFSFLNHFLHQDDRSEDEEYFELLGLKLYQDDLLLIGLIFFLYKEDIKDQYLFFALILLLLS